MKNENCVFCKIASGSIDVAKIYEDDKIFAFLDAKPINEGHTLLIPKAHVQLIIDLDDSTLEKIILVMKNLNKKLRKSNVKCEDLTIILSDGKSADQEIPHVHFHLIPRFKGDGFEIKPKRLKVSLDDLNKTAKKIKS